MIRNLKCLMFYCNMVKSANYSEKEIMSFVKCVNTLKKDNIILGVFGGGRKGHRGTVFTVH